MTIYFVVSKGGHLWEFLLELLKNSLYSPAFIKWENREQGIFRVVNSTQVAALWGKRKNNPRMNFEKLSRALRFVFVVLFDYSIQCDRVSHFAQCKSESMENMLHKILHKTCKMTKRNINLHGRSLMGPKSGNLT